MCRKYYTGKFTFNLQSLLLITRPYGLLFLGIDGLGHNMAQSVKLDSAWTILVSLLQAAGHWEAAVHVLCDATMSRLVPNIILRSAAISACEKAVFVG